MPWCQGSLCGWGCCRQCAPRVRLRRSFCVGRLWDSGRCRQPASQGHTDLNQPARRGRAARQWRAGLPVSGSVWRRWLGSTSLAPLSGKPLLQGQGREEKSRTEGQEESFMSLCVTADEWLSLSHSASKYTKIYIKYNIPQYKVQIYSIFTYI